MGTSTTTFEAERPAIAPRYVHHLRGTCERLLEAFRELESPQTDAAKIHRDTESLVEDLQSLGDDLETRIGLCQELARALSSDSSLLDVDGEDVEAEDADSSGEQSVAWHASELRQALLDSRHVAQDTNEIVEAVYKIAPLRSELGALESDVVRESVGKALMGCGVRVERVYDHRKRLDEALRELEEVEIEGEVDLSPLSADEPEPNAETPSEEPEPVESSEPEEDDPDAMLQTIVIPRADPNGMQTLEDAQKAIAAQAAKYAAANPRPARKEPLSTKDFERVRGAITQWARLKTFVPSDIGFQIEVVDWDDEHASRVTIEVGSSARTATGAVPKLEELDYRGELPRSLLRGVRGKRELEKLFTQESCEDLPHGPREAVLAEATQRFDSAFLNSSIWPFLSEGEDASSAPNANYRMRVEAIPVRRVGFRFQADSGKRAGTRFEAWIYGEESSVWVRNLPRLWTIKAAAWFTSFATVSAGIGYGLAKLLVGY